jgi:cysteine desulfurase/selenocysteine lyase
MGVGMEAVRAHEVDMVEHMLAALGEVDGITIYGPRDASARGAAVSFSLPDLHPHDIAQLVDREAVCIRAGHHCAQPLMRVLGVGATARASAYLYNSHDEIDVLVRALASARAAFG